MKNELKELQEQIDKLARRVEFLEALKELPKPFYPTTVPPNQWQPQLHYHNGMPCYNNPCVWC